MSVILIDAKNALFRFGWTFQALHSKSGEPTGAVYGMLNCMLKLRRKYPGSSFVVVWDGKNVRSGWRYELYPGYKSNRKKEGDVPAETRAILAQIPVTMEVLNVLCIKQVQLDTIEADDAISIIAQACPIIGRHPFVYSGDQDFYQLVTRNVTVLQTDIDAGAVTPEMIWAKYKCGPKDVLKVRALAGDSSDHIPPAVRGIGVVRGSKLVKEGLDPAQCNRPGTAPRWGAAYRNYELMRLPLNAKDDRFDAIERTYLSAMVKEVLGHVQDHECTQSYQKMLRRLASLDMLTAIEDRHKLWQLSH